MAVLAELFLVLAGFETGLDPQSFQHPAEGSVIERAYRAGQQFSVLRDACAARDDPIAKTIESLVVQGYLYNLADVETQTLTELHNSKQLPLYDALFRSANIMGLTVDAWEGRFKIALRLLAELNLAETPLVQIIEEVQVASRLQAGLGDVAELCNRCQDALNLQWLAEVKACLTGSGLNKAGSSELAFHPCLVGTVGPALLANSMVSVNQLSLRQAKADHATLARFLDVAERNARLIDGIKLPLTSDLLIPILKEIHFNVHGLVKSKILHASDIKAMIAFLRQILLFRSGLFIDEFIGARGIISFAITRYCDVDPTFAESVWALVESSIHFDGDAIELDVKWPLSTLFTPDQCAVYCSIHSTFAAIVTTMYAIAPGSGTTMHTYYLFLSVLWEEFQKSMDEAFAGIEAAIEADQDASVHQVHSRILKRAVQRMFLDVPSVRKQIQVIIEHVEAKSDSTKPVRDLATALSHMPGGKDLPLKAFIDLPDT